MIEVQIPSLGESITQGVLIAWHKPDGATVGLDEAICELETDKANVDIPARAAGVLHHLKKEGETVNVGEAIARIDESAAMPPVTVPPVPSLAESVPVAQPTPPVGAPAALEDLSPAVRCLVEEHHLDPKTIAATGPGGRVTKEDVEKHLAQSNTTQPAPSAPPRPPKPRPSPNPASPLTPAASPACP